MVEDGVALKDDLLFTTLAGADTKVMANSTTGIVYFRPSNKCDYKPVPFADVAAPIAQQKY